MTMTLTLKYYRECTKFKNQVTNRILNIIIFIESIIFVIIKKNQDSLLRN